MAQVLAERSNLFKKYNVPGPRYTSYPTVPYWDTNPTEQQWIESLRKELDDSRRSNQGAAIYVHIPFCEALCTYCGCNTRITRNRAVAAPYIKTVLKEWSTLQKRIDLSQAIVLDELHLGGGTPTFLTPDEIKSLVEPLLESVQIKHEAEYSVEAHPGVTSKEHLSTLSTLGFKRLSFGIQDFDPRVQEIVNRHQSKEQVRDLVNHARSVGFSSINYDLIYGLPLQTLDSVRDTVTTLIEHRPDRIAYYSYAHVPWIKPGQRKFTESDLPAGDQKRALYELGRELLEAAGYVEIGMDHFALKSDSLWAAAQQRTLHRNFMGYTARHVSPLIGLGVSAIGDTWTQFAQNEKVLERYAERVEKNEVPIFRGHVLNEEDLMIRRQILDLMTQFETKLKPDNEADIRAKLKELESDGLVAFKDSRLFVTGLGRPFLRNVCMAFDARLSRAAPATELFSKTV